MATRTDNLKLSKAETSDAIKSTLTANNQNFDKLDGVITRLKNNQLRGTASGTEITVTDAGEVESILHISGNSEQDSRSGKNILKKGSSYINSTSAGITFQVNSDESVTLNGTNDGTNNSTIRLWNDTNNPLVIPAGTYNVGKTGNDKVEIKLYDGTTYKTVANNTQDTVTLFKDMSCSIIFIQIAKETTATFNNFTIYPIMVKDTDSIEPYEPYGLQPSPDFPSEIRSVKSKSDNLFDISAKTDNTALAWATGIESELTGAIASDFMTIDSIKELSSNYTFSAYYYDSNKSYLGNGPTLVKDATAGGYKNTIVPNNSSIVYFRVWYRNNSGGNPSDMTILTDIMLNKGTEVLPYQEFGYVPVEVKVEGKNLLDISQAKIGYSISNSTGELLVHSQNGAGENFIKVLPNTTYTISANQQIMDLRLSQYSNDLSHIQRVSKENSKSLTITTTENTHYLRWSLNYDMETEMSKEILEDIKLQLEKGTTATPYEPYKLTTISLPLGDLELRSTPDGTRDTFEKVDGVWNKANKIWSVVFDGSDDEGWKDEGNQKFDDTFYFLSNGFIRQTTAIKDSLLYCNRFTQRAIYSVNQEGIKIEGGSSEWNLRIRVNRDRLATQDVAGFKTWLSSNPMEVVWQLKTPTYTPITDQALITALDELEDLILHKGYNYITATAVNGVKAHLDLSYYKDINIVLDNINASILSLGGGINV